MTNPTPQNTLRDRIGAANLAVNLPAIGEYWPNQGGFYAGIIRNPGSGEQWHLIMAEQATAPASWGEYENVPNTSSRHDGLANTNAMRLAPRPTPIPEEIINLEIDGLRDWYLPAQFEQNLLCINLHDKLDPHWHWSSTQYSAGSAWIQDFETGYQDLRYKDGKRAARAVRRLPI